MKAKKFKRTSYLILDPGGWPVDVHYHLPTAHERCRSRNERRPAGAAKYIVVPCTFVMESE